MQGAPVISAFDVFKVGLGPSSSHAVGPMRAANWWAHRLREAGLFPSVSTVEIDLYGSLASTGAGHGTIPALIAGLAGTVPAHAEPEQVRQQMEQARARGTVRLLQEHQVRLQPDEQIHAHRGERIGDYSNGMRFSAIDSHGAVLDRASYFSIGGGFICDDTGLPVPPLPPRPTLPYGFTSGSELLALAAAHDLSIADIVAANEQVLSPRADIRRQLLQIWHVMDACIDAGCTHPGVLPGGLNVARRAPELTQSLTRESAGELHAMEWVTAWAIAVNEENAAGGRVVTAPTNGAAGIIPAVLKYAVTFLPDCDDATIVEFLLTATAIASLIKDNASLSGAEVGCQGEVGSACAMAAAGLAAILGGTPAQVENAAEIGMEHHLGLTCDPVGGLVQIPCIERNAMAACTAINAAQLAVRGTGAHHVSLDQVIATMRMTGADMMDKYKETSTGGLALNVGEC